MHDHHWPIFSKTQIAFNKVVRQSKKIHDNLRLLQSIGISNESNSLLQQIIEDIQALDTSGLSKRAIVNCIKASSFGKTSAIEPRSTEQSAKLLLNIKRSQPKVAHYSGDQSRKSY